MAPRSLRRWGGRCRGIGLGVGLGALWALNAVCQPAWAQSPSDRELPSGEPAPDASLIVVLGAQSALGDRVRGQTVDLGARVVTEPRAASGSWQQQAVTARDVADTTGAALVVWVAEMDSAPGERPTPRPRAFVAVLLSGAERLYARDVGPALSTADEAEESAVLELAALSARAALESLEAPEAVGMPIADLPTALPEPPPAESQERAEEPTSAPAPVPPVLDVEPAAAPQGDSQKATQFVFGVGTAAAYDGLATLVWPSLQVRAGVEVSPFRGILVGEWGARRAIDTTHARLMLERHALSLQGELAVWEGSEWVHPQLALAGGAVLYRRATEVRSPLATGTPEAALWSPLVHLSAAVDIGRLEQPVGQRLQVSLGADVLPWAPAYEVVAEGGGARDRLQVGRVQPRANLAWFLSW